ncbi:MAG: HNH endonuclease [Methanobrevibacter sp.]|nr:HNH endonuclease [Methanobrevibacter sp.]
MGPHHLKKVKPSKELYANEDNIVIICKTCHNRYHNQYKRVNPKTFLLFARKMWNKQGDSLKRERNMYRNKYKKCNKIVVEDKMNALMMKQIRGLPVIESYSDFVDAYNDHLVSVASIIQVIGDARYRRYRKEALGKGDIQQRPYGLRFGH